MSRYKNIIFDLDGTLIDSAPGIIKSFRNAFHKIYNKDCTHDIKSLIGPPINQVLKSINNESDAEVIASFLEEFKSYYDNIGYKNVNLYEDVREVLEILSSNNLKLFIATNKRTIPTKKILEILSINQYFHDTVSLDSFEVNFNNKSELVANLLNRHNLEHNFSLIVGDTIHDSIAAYQNNLDFAFVKYGYGKCDDFKCKLANIKQLLNIY